MIILAILACAVLSSCQSNAGRELDKLVNVGTHSLHIRCTGKGTPTIVIDSGVGDTSERWQSFQSQAAQFWRVCTYDRAGYGKSQPGPLPRDSQREAEELQQLLKNASVKGPYLLVGHSLGALNMQVFAGRYPELVSGLVLLDPTPLDFITGQAFPELYQVFKQQAVEIQHVAEAARKSTDPEAQAKVDYLEAVASENAALIGDSASQVSAIESFGDIPLIVIGSGQANPAFGPDAEAFQQFWIEQNRALAEKSRQGKFELAQKSSHYIHEDAPELVLDAIRQVGE
jgi:pimeloyl-ACP methyl ester carboxylesterase